MGNQSNIDVASAAKYEAFSFDGSQNDLFAVKRDVPPELAIAVAYEITNVAKLVAAHSGGTASHENAALMAVSYLSSMSEALLERALEKMPASHAVGRS